MYLFKFIGRAESPDFIACSKSIRAFERLAKKHNCVLSILSVEGETQTANVEADKETSIPVAN